VLTSEAIIAIHGSHGTLSEIALAMKCRVPVVGLETWSLIPPDGETLPLTPARNAEEAVTAALKLASSA
jgi:predicted Rossmann-fold nucleotide-binding protein